MTDEPPIELGPETSVLERLSPEHIEQVILETASMSKFRKLAISNGLIFHVQGTRVHVAPTYYLSKSKAHNVGDVKEAAHERRVISLTMTNLEDFGAQAFWYERFPMTRTGEPKPPVFEFDNAFVGGKRTGAPTKFFTAPTPMTEEIVRCLTA